MLRTCIRTTNLAGLATRLLMLFLVMMLAARPAAAQGIEAKLVGLELALLIDVSASVSEEEFRLQLDGLASAVQSPAVIRAIQSEDGIAISVIQWAQESFQYKSIEWLHVEDESDAVVLAAQILTIRRQTPSGQTAIGDALAFALNEIEQNGFAGIRRVIDLSGDGRANDGRSVSRARQNVLDQGITINGLAILNEMADLKEYFKTKLIGGTGSFVLSAIDYSDFRRAMAEKLEREIRSTPVANAVPRNGKNNRLAAASGGTLQPAD